MDTVNLNRLAYFTAVVDTGSFTRAAERLGITKTVVSQQVRKLEEELRTALLMRTTRRVVPTEAGRRLHARSVAILSEAEDAVAEVGQSNAEPSGVLRIAAPNGYGASEIAPLAAQFSRQYPACTVELLLSDARIDPIAEQIDFSVRIGWLDDSNLHARRIGDFRQFLVARPDLEGLAHVQEPEDLANLAFIANGALKDPRVLHLVKGDFERQTVRAQPSVTINTTPAVLSATLAGGGFAVLPDFLVAGPIAAGDLVRVLPDWSLPAGGIHIVYPTARYRPAKVTSFVAMLIQHTKRSAVMA